MINQILETINQQYPLQERDAGQYKKLKASGMTFSIRCFEAKGLGSVSAMTASGFFGLMKMDTLIITPTEVDMPLYSYDRVHAMGNDTLIFELYDTLTGNTSLSALEAIKAAAGELPDHDLGTHWYDSIKLPQSISKKGKKVHTPAFNTLTLEYLNAFLAAAANASACDKKEKHAKSSVYVEGLLTNGGPSTDVFKKAIGDEKTADLFRRVLFATRD